MTWGLVIGAVIVAALVYGYWEHGKDSRHLAKLFAVLAATTAVGLMLFNRLTVPSRATR